MYHCNTHKVCQQGFIRDSEQLDILLRCMVQRRRITKRTDGKFVRVYAW